MTDNQKLRSFFSNDRFAALAGIEVVTVSDGYCLCRMKVEDKHLNAVNVVQGGAIFTLADYAFAIASNSRGQVALAVHADISFIASRSAGILYAEAREVADPRRLGFYEVKVTDQDDEPVARFTGMVYRKNQVLNLD